MLENALEEVISINEKGEKVALDKDRAMIIYIDYLNNSTGFINKRIIKGYNFLKRKKFPKAIDSLFGAYIGGAMTRKDQDLFALIAEKKSYKLTIQNALITTVMAPQYYGHAKALDMMTDFVGINISTSTLGTSMAVGIGLANVLRAGIAYKTKRSYASIGMDGLLINLPTYTKHLMRKRSF